MNDLILPSFAKINLLLRVTGRRKDGYHNLETVFQTIDLHDTLRFRFVPDTRFQLFLEIEDSEIPADHTNLIYKAFHSFHEEFRIPGRIEVRVEKKIPVESGLGGGSSNAATTLVYLCRIFNWPIPRRKLLTIARKLGADVPYFLYGGTALGTGRGDRIRILDDWPGYPLLLVHPEVSCSTARVYRAFDESSLLTQKLNFIKIRLDQRPESLRDLFSRTGNDLEQVVFTLYPELDSIKNKLIELGAGVAALTGSGSSIFGIFEKADDRDKAAGYFENTTKANFVSRFEYLSQLEVSKSPLSVVRRQLRKKLSTDR